MIFERALRRELASTAGAVFTTLFTITITIMLIKILGQAAGGQVASADVVALLGFAGLNYLPIILTLTTFVSVLMVISRSYQDSEMVVWFASGLSLSRWIKPVLSFGIPIAILVATLSFIVTPWANRQSAEFRERFAKREDIARIAPGKFQESSSADRIFFVEGVSADTTKVQNVFVNTVKNDRTSIVVAKEGTVEVDANGDKFLIMNHGRRYDGAPTQPDFRLMEFERYGVLVSKKPQSTIGDTSARTLPTTMLLVNRNSYNLGELLWRISVPIMCLVLMLLAIPLSFVNPRAGRSANLLIALLLVVVYLNMVNVSQSLVTKQRTSFDMTWWPVHAAAAALVMALFAWRLCTNSRYHPALLWSAVKRAVLFRKAGT